MPRLHSSPRRRRTLPALAAMCLATSPALAVSMEQTNSCATTADDPCRRTGTCSIQGADWFQAVTVDRADIFDTQGWPGLCDMVHVALVQGDCEPPGGQSDVTAYLSATSFAEIPSIAGPLACAGEPTAAVGTVPNGGDVPGDPLTVTAEADGGIVLDWGASCLSTDDDYVVYEGLLGDFTSHVAVTCGTGGATSWALTPAAGGRYYLVAPTDGTSEGSHGRDSSGAERTTEAGTCLPPSVGACP